MVEGKCTYTLPFDVCKFCPNHSADVRVQDITGDGKIITRTVAMVCSRENICPKIASSGRLWTIRKTDISYNEKME